MATNVTEEKLIVSAQDQTAVALNSANERVKRLRASTNNLGASFKANASTILAATGTITAGIFTIKKAFDFADEFARFQQNQLAFNSQVTSLGANATQVFNEIKAASGGLIDNNALLQSANTALSLGINVGLLGDMLEVSRAKARDMGITTQEAFEKLTIALARGSKLRLDDLGIIIDSAKANEKYAESIGVSVNALTDQQKALAFQTEAMNLGKEALTRYNLEQNTLTENMQEFTATMANIRVEAGALALRLGTGLIAVFQGLQSVVLGLSSMILVVPVSLAEITDWFGITEDAAQSWQIEMTAAMEASNEKAEQAAKNMKLALSSTAELLEAQQAALRQPTPTDIAPEIEPEGDDLTSKQLEAKKKFLEAMKADEELKTKIEAEYMRRRFKGALADNKARNKLEAQRLATAVSISSSLLSISNNSSRELFNINKGLSLAQTAQDTARAVTAALAAPPGPPFTIPSAIKAGAIGAAQLAKIASTSFGGGGGGGAGLTGGGGGPVGVAAPVAPPAPAGPAPAETNLTVRVIAEGPQEGSIISSVVTEFEDAFSDGRVNLTTQKVT